MGPGGLWWTNILNLALPPQSLRSDTRLEHEDPVSHTAQRKKEKKKERKKESEREKEGGREEEKKEGRKKERKNNKII